MGYKLGTSDDGRYVILTVTGPVKGKTMLNYIIAAHALGKELGIHRYFVDATGATNIDSATGNFEFANTDIKKEQRIDKTAVVAALVRPGDDSHDFVEVALNNASLPIKLFRDRKEATAFLNQGAAIQ